MLSIDLFREEKNQICMRGAFKLISHKARDCSFVYRCVSSTKYPWFLYGCRAPLKLSPAPEIKAAFEDAPATDSAPLRRHSAEYESQTTSSAAFDRTRPS